VLQIRSRVSSKQPEGCWARAPRQVPMAASFTDSFNVAQAAAMCLAEARRGSQVWVPPQARAGAAPGAPHEPAAEHAPASAAPPAVAGAGRPDARAGEPAPSLRTADDGPCADDAGPGRHAAPVAGRPGARHRATRAPAEHAGAMEPGAGAARGVVGGRMALRGSLSADEQRVLIALMMLRSVY